MTPRYCVAWSRDQKLWLVLDQHLKRTRSSFAHRDGAEIYARILNREERP